MLAAAWVDETLCAALALYLNLSKTPFGKSGGFICSLVSLSREARLQRDLLEVIECFIFIIADTFQEDVLAGSKQMIL